MITFYYLIEEFRAMWTLKWKYFKQFWHVSLLILLSRAYTSLTITPAKEPTDPVLLQPYLLNCLFSFKCRAVQRQHVTSCSLCVAVGGARQRGAAVRAAGPDSDR
eukprot:3938345-Rhodomonas_salina.1